MDSEDFKLVFVFSLTCAIWYCAGFLSGYSNSCNNAYEDGRTVGVAEGISEAATPSDQ